MLLRDGATLPRARVSCERVRHPVLGRLELQPHAGQGSTDPVVEVPPDPSSLLLARPDQCLAAALQPHGQPQGCEGGCDLVTEELHQLAVAGSDGPLPEARCDVEVADELAVVGERDLVAAGDDVTHLGCRSPVVVDHEVEAGALHPEGLDDCAAHRRGQLVRRHDPP